MDTVRNEATKAVVNLHSSKANEISFIRPLSVLSNQKISVTSHSFIDQYLQITNSSSTTPHQVLTSTGIRIIIIN